jgi:hypothetical protein
VQDDSFEPMESLVWWEVTEFKPTSLKPDEIEDSPEKEQAGIASSSQSVYSSLYV